MGEAKQRRIRLHNLGAGYHVINSDMDASIEEFESWIDKGTLEGFIQIAKLKTDVPDVYQIKLLTFTLEKREAFDMICQMRKAFMETMGFKEE